MATEIQTQVSKYEKKITQRHKVKGQTEGLGAEDE